MASESRCHWSGPTQPTGALIQRRVEASKSSQIPRFTPTRISRLSARTNPAGEYTEYPSIAPRGSGAALITREKTLPESAAPAAIDPYAIESLEARVE